MADWDRRFMELARHVGAWSKDRSRQVGAVVVGPDNEVRALGYNGFPRGSDDLSDERHDRPEKYLWIEHAERNAIYTAARMGVPLRGCRIYVPWFPCMDCARAIIQSGIGEVIALKPNEEDPTWGQDFRRAIALFKETSVKVVLFEEGSRDL